MRLQRSREFAKALQDVEAEFIGPREKEMFDIGMLVTRKEKRGRGYASALVHIATDTVSRPLGLLLLLNSRACRRMPLAARAASLRAIPSIVAFMPCSGSRSYTPLSWVLRIPRGTESQY